MHTFPNHALFVLDLRWGPAVRTVQSPPVKYKYKAHNLAAYDEIFDIDVGRQPILLEVAS